MKGIILITLLLAGISSTAFGNGRPKYQTIPFNEDWSQVAQVEESDSLDSLKYIKLNPDSTLWVSLGGELRGRVEAWSNSGFGDSSENDDIFYRHRLRFHADLHAGKNIRIFAEGINALTESRDLPGGRRTGDVDAADLLNLFIDIHVPLAAGVDFTFRAGRQDLLSGVQRVLSSGRWGNTIKAWDGFSGILSHKDWKVHSFWTQFVQGDKYGFNEPDENHRFYGFYGTVKNYLDFYWLADEKDVVDDDRHTIGARIHGALADTGYDYDIETAYQFGHRGAGDVSAFMFSALAGRRFSSHAGRPRVWVAFDYASGDDDPNDANIGTYSKVFANRTQVVRL